MKNAQVLRSSSFLSHNMRLKKKSVYLKKITKYISKLKTTLNEKQNYKKLSFSVNNESLKK